MSGAVSLMRILVVSQYFPPEPVAASNRLDAFVRGLRERGHRLTVVCEQPNHPSGTFAPGYGRRPVISERDDGDVVRRLWVFASPVRTRTRRIAGYGTFAAGAGAAVALAPRHDVVLASSPPLPGALAAAAAAAVRRTPFVLDVRDIWPAAAVAFGEISDPRLIGWLEAAERWLYRRARRVTAATEPFCEHIDRVAGREVSVALPNGAPDDLLALEVSPPPRGGTFVVGYVGNLGLAHGLEVILDAAQRLRGEDIRFLIVGDGPMAGPLREQRDRLGLDTVDVRSSVPRDRLASVLVSCDALFIQFRADPFLATSISSKLYDAMAVGRPAIVAAQGETARLARETGCGLVIVPEDGEALVDAIRHLAADRGRGAALGAAGRRAAAQHARSRQIGRLEAVLAQAAGAPTD